MTLSTHVRRADDLAIAVERRSIAARLERAQVNDGILLSLRGGREQQTDTHQ
jgi:hypothetical protein